MSERISKALEEAKANQTEAERILKITAPSLAKRLLEVAGGDAELAEDLMKDVTNVAGNVATLAVANRRVDAEENRRLIFFKTELHPDNMKPRQDSLLNGVGAAGDIMDIVKPVFDDADSGMRLTLLVKPD